MANEGPQNPAEAGLKAMQDAMGGVVASQQRSVGLAQDWAESVIASYKSQEETNRALKESLDAYRNVVESASETQERNMELAQNFFDDIVETLRGQIESSRALLLEPATRQQEFFQNVTQEWIDAYVRLLNAPLEFYRASAQRAEGGEK